MKKYNKSILTLILITVFFTVLVSAQKSLEKPFQKWSKEEAVKVLTNSGWVQSYQSAEGLAASDQQGIARSQNEQTVSRNTTIGSVARNVAPAPIVIRLHSALPVRQALVRLRQIEAGYDKFDDKKRAEFDELMKNLLDCPLCKDYYVVTMNRFADSSSQGVQEGLFQTLTFEQIKGNVRLVNDKNEKREVIGFTPPNGIGDFAVFFFKRKDENGNELIKSDTKEFKFVFDNNFKSNKNQYAALLPNSFEFKVSKLMVGDKIEF